MICYNTHAVTKYEQLIETLKTDILGGKYSRTEPIPSVRALMRRFSLSDSTIGRALDELTREGLISRRRGSGTFVTRKALSRKLGLILPGMGYSEFFPLVAGEFLRCANDRGYTTLIGDITARSAEGRVTQARRFAESFVREGVSGVVFMPLEFVNDASDANRRIISVFDEAGVGVVLLDRDITSPSGRGRYDVIGIDNYDAGFRVATHLIERGARRIGLLAQRNASPCRRDRILGAMAAAGLSDAVKCRALFAEADDFKAIRAYLRRNRPDAFICSSDRQSARLKVALDRLGLRVPDDVMLAGFNDIQIAGLMTPALTSIHQPCSEIARRAFEVLLERIAHPGAPVEEIRLSAPLVVRASTWGDSWEGGHGRKDRAVRKLPGGVVRQGGAHSRSRRDRPRR